MATFKQLQHEYDITRGLCCFDRDPANVDYDWIKRNAFQLEHYLDSSDEESEINFAKCIEDLRCGSGRSGTRVEAPDRYL